MEPNKIIQQINCPLWLLRALVCLTDKAGEGKEEETYVVVSACVGCMRTLLAKIKIACELHHISSVKQEKSGDYIISATNGCYTRFTCFLPIQSSMLGEHCVGWSSFTLSKRLLSRCDFTALSLSQPIQEPLWIAGRSRFNSLIQCKCKPRSHKASVTPLPVYSRCCAWLSLLASLSIYRLLWGDEDRQPANVWLSVFSVCLCCNICSPHCCSHTPRVPAARCQFSFAVGRFV